MLFIPMRQYFRPDGHSKTGTLVIKNAYTIARQNAIEVIQQAGIEFTLESSVGGMVNICMDDGTFDYKFELVTSEQVNDTVLRLIDEFNLDDYRAASAAYAEAENAAPAWVHKVID